MTEIHPSPTFCALPWSHLFLGNTGKFYPCCLTEGEAGSLKSKLGKDLLAPQIQNLNEVWSSPLLEDLRRKMTGGQWHPLCGPCRSQEQSGQKSYRQFQNEELLPHLDMDFSAQNFKPSPLSLDLRMGNTCNLKCRMCNPETSSLWIEEWNKLHPDDLDEEEVNTYKKISWHRSPQFRSFLSSLLPNLRKINLGGGEPFLEIEVLSLLEECVKTGHAKKIALSFNTNLTIIPKKMIELFTSFKRVDLFVSIDAYGELNNYIRFPSQFSTIINNLSKLLVNRSSLNIGALEILTTAQVYNIFDLDKLFIYLHETFGPHFPWPRITFVHDPDYLNIQVLPDNLKSQAKDKLLELIQRPQFKSATPVIESIIHYMYQEDRSLLFTKFLQKSATLDKMRGQDFFATSSFPSENRTGPQ